MKRLQRIPFTVFIFLSAFVLLVSLSFAILIRNEPGSTSSDPDADAITSLPAAAMFEVAQKEIPAEVMQRGENVYKTYCLACHQANGTGNPGMFPPLDQTKKVLGNKDELIGIILHGLSGKIEVKGETYYQAMAPHKFLSDQQIADVLTYIRNSFGNSASMVTKEEVRKVRASGNQS